MEPSQKRVDERFDDFLKKVDDMETELKEWKDKYIKLETTLNQTITMTNQLIVNVNASNQFIAELHNALADAGLVKKPSEIIKDIKDDNIPEGARRLIRTGTGTGNGGSQLILDF
jgi:hypothetical protein